MTNNKFDLPSFLSTYWLISIHRGRINSNTDLTKQGEKKGGWAHASICWVNGMQNPPFFYDFSVMLKSTESSWLLCNNRKYVSLFSGYLHVLVIRLVMEGRTLKASGLVNFPASTFQKWPCFRLLTTIVILVRGLKLFVGKRFFN